MGGGPGRRTRVGEEVEARYEKAEGDRGTMVGCREPDVVWGSAKRAGSLSGWHSPGETGARDTFSCENIPFAVKELISCTKWQEDVTAQCEKFAEVTFPKWKVVDKKETDNKAENFVTLTSLEPFHRQAADEMVIGGMEDVWVREFRQGTRQAGLKRLCHKRVFSVDEVVNYPVLKEPKLMAGDLLIRKAMSEKVRLFDAQQAAMARLHSRVEYY